jgi:GAF domain-containing protein
VAGARKEQGSKETSLLLRGCPIGSNRGKLLLGSAESSFEPDSAVDPLDPSTEFRRIQALHETGLLTSPDLPELDEICRRAREHFGVATALVTLIDRDTQIIKAREGSDLEKTPRAWAFCDYTIRADQVFVVPDATQDKRFAANPLVTGQPFIRFYAGAPLVYLQDIRLGALCLLDPRPRQSAEFTVGDKAELVDMADEVVSIIVRRKLAALSAILGHNE